MKCSRRKAPMGTTPGAPLCLSIALQKCAKGCATMAVVRFFFRGQLGKGFADLGKIEQWVVSETVLASGRVENDAFSRAAKGMKNPAVAGHGQDADETRGALLFWNPF